MRVVVLGWGNESRGDDGLGPALLRRIEALGRRDVRAIEDYQLQIEHALDLDEAELALFIDAARAGPAPFGFREIAPRNETTPSTHALSPEALLDIATRVLKTQPPPAFMLAVRGESFGLGEGLSSEGAERLEAAWRFLQGLIDSREIEAWRSAAAQHANESAKPSLRAERSNPGPHHVALGCCAPLAMTGES